MHLLDEDVPEPTFFDAICDQIVTRTGRKSPKAGEGDEAENLPISGEKVG